MRLDLPIPRTLPPEGAECQATAWREHPSGGGAGGLSVAIGYLGTAPTQVGAISLTVASSAATGGGASTGGAEGDNADGNTYSPTAPAGTSGKNGLAAMTQDLTP